MNILRKGKINFIVLLVYLVTLQVSTGSAFYSVCFTVVNGATFVAAEQLPKTNQKPQITLKKHLNVNNNEKNSGAAAHIFPSYSLPELTSYLILKISHKINSPGLTLYAKLKDRAPPSIS